MAETGERQGRGAAPEFVHLRVRSAYSLLEGALPIKRLVGLAAADAMPALAIADTGNLFGALEFSFAAADAGIQPIIGLTLAVDFGDETAETAAGRGRAKRRDFPQLALFARSEAGYRNLMRLSSRAFLDTDPAERPHVGLADLEAHAEGLIGLTGGPGGPLNEALEAGRPEQARTRAERLKSLYSESLYVELQRHGLEAEKAAETPLIELAYALNLPLVATNDAFFPAEADFEAHDALLCIAEGALVSDEDRRRLTPEHRFKTRSEMCALFADLPEALQNTMEIAERCTYWPRPAQPMLPKFRGAQGDEDEELKAQARAGLKARLEVHGPADGHDAEDYEKRLEFELGVITDMRYSGYFLIVADFIQWAKARSIPVGPGRGSGAGSLVAWSLTITDLDPIRFGLLFERFLNPERVSMPDFDIDFCQDRRDEVIRYVQQRYGRDQVAQIITFGTLQARAVLRDVGRVLEMRYGEVDRLAKLVPYNPAHPVNLADAIAGEPRLQEARDSNPLVAQLLRIALRLEGLYRHASTHAAGIVIGERSLHEIVPLYRDPRSEFPVTQFNMKWVEQAGLVKFDFLGLKTLTVIETAVKLLARRGVTLDIGALPLDDRKTYDMLSSGDTAGVFQLESGGMRDAVKRMRPDRLEDIIALVSLYRPGPMDHIPTYCNRKHDLEKPDYLHDSLKPILEETYGVIIYQEQVMRIAQVMSGYSLGQADLLRRAMGKKIKSEMTKQRAGFVEGAVKNGISREQAEHVFELVAKFADYGFNKSHAAAYALIAYQTAYLKANYPTEFIAASMTLDMGNPDKLALYEQELERQNIALLPPDINRSEVEFSVDV
ncbi:MAG TPA: DNA polymerase III subunit alpha, partial [Hyphomicrobiales bacterium]|nr:DNA polymerase III subunit alpha [Hyphomicrobiales bacterium]